MPEEALKTLEDIKKLLVLQLSEQGVSNVQLGETLGVSYKTIERMLPKKGKLRPAKA